MPEHIEPLVIEPELRERLLRAVQELRDGPWTLHVSPQRYNSPDEYRHRTQVQYNEYEPQAFVFRARDPFPVTVDPYTYPIRSI